MPFPNSVPRPTRKPWHRPFARLIAPWLAGLLALASPTAQANRLQVSPTLIEIGAGRPAEAIWLTNPGQAPVPIQVRVFRWDQREGQDRLDPTGELIVSPSQVVIAPGQRQLIRILREGDAPAAELGYRILVDELAGLGQGEAQPNGLQFRLRYSIPVFVAPRPGSSEARPLLAASLHHDASTRRATLEIDNRGDGRARLAEALLVAPGRRPVELSPGLLGYVLSGQSMRWPVEMPATSGSKPLALKVRVNGETSPRLIPVRIIDGRIIDGRVIDGRVIDGH